MAVAVMRLTLLLIFAIGMCYSYILLTPSLKACGASTIVCVVVSLIDDEHFDLDLFKQRIGNYGKNSKTT